MTAEPPTLASEAGTDAADLEIAVIGAGAVGVTAAYHLAREGASVTLYERGTVGSGSSGRAAGICYNAFADELDAEIGRESIERFRALSGDETFPFVECPYVWAAKEGETDAKEAIAEQVQRMQANGTIALEMDGTALGDRFPALRTDSIAIAGVAGAAGYTDPARYTATMAAAATGAGATLETETPVAIERDPLSIRLTDSDERRAVDRVLVAAGAHSKAVVEAAGLELAMKPYRVQAVTASISDASPLEGPMYYDATEGFYIRPHETGLLIGDGVSTREADPDDWMSEADADFVSTAIERVRTRFRDQNESPLEVQPERSWAGLCTATPDRDPLVGELHDGMYVATGFHGEGFMRAPAIGERLATQLLGGDGIDAFDPTRVSGTKPFEIRDGI